MLDHIKNVLTDSNDEQAESLGKQYPHWRCEEKYDAELMEGYLSHYDNEGELDQCDSCKDPEFDVIGFFLLDWVSLLFF